MIPPVAKIEVDTLKARGVAVDLVDHNQQCYVHASALEVSSPPWSSEAVDILIAIPATYDNAQLDGFYVGLPLSFNGGTHPRINGAEITLLGRQWKLISWHYPDGKPWTRGQDCIETHIAHCRGFFFHRGATNAYT